MKRGVTIVGTSSSTRGECGWPCFHCGKPLEFCRRIRRVGRYLKVQRPPGCCKKCRGDASH